MNHTLFTVITGRRHIGKTELLRRDWNVFSGFALERYFAAKLAVTVSGTVVNPYAAPYLTATTLTGKLKFIIVNGKERKPLVRDGGLYAAPRGLTIFVC